MALMPFITFISLILIPASNALASTDTITWGGSNDRTGYQNNHNMDPAIVGSPQFGLLYKTLLPRTYPIGGQNVPEQIFSQPLVYTGGDGVQYVYIATTQNNVYKMNAKTGVVVTSRNLHRPFLVSDLDGCVDINPTIGVTATGVIDPDTDTWYLTAKTYQDQNLNGAIGKPNGRYYIHAINTNDLSERSNFPVPLEGLVSSNNPLKSFGGGIHHQRPGLLHYNQYVYAGFASHCAQYNFSGWIFGWDKGSGQIVEQFTTEGAGVPTSTPGGGIWMSGGGISSDGQGSMFLGTGNGYASQLNGIPVNGRSPPTALEEAALHIAINDDGSLNIVDFFMPWEKTQLDGADKDLGTTPLELLPSQFQCGNITRMGVITGKSGKTYWLDLDNLGGYQNGPNKLDNVIQVTQNENSVYAGAGVYPLEGGYIYINVIQFPTHVFKFSCDNGVASFIHVADSPENNAYILGVGHGTVTSLNGQAGTGLLWTSDVEGSNLRIYNAVPNNGLLTEINSFVTPGTTKFTRPVFGDGVVFQGTTLGYIYAYGSPVNLPMNCTAPQFGLVNLNSTSQPMSVQCQANIALTVTAASLLGNPNFVISGLPMLPYQVAQGQIFTFQATFMPMTVGPLSSSVVLNTTQQTSGFATNTPVQLKGSGQSQAALLTVSPNTVSWNGVITGQEIGGVNQSLTLDNAGNSVLQITSIKYSLVGETGPWVTPDNTTGDATSVSAFTFYHVPISIPPNSGVTIPINFNPLVSGTYAAYLQINSNGGTNIVDVLATGSDLPHAVLEFQSPNGSWDLYDNTTAFSFGNVTENTSRYLKMRLSNNGSTNAAAISVTVSKPPFGIAGSIIGAVNNVDLAEGTLIYAGQNMTATLYCSVPKSQIDVDSYNGTAQWTMNLNDLTFQKQRIQFVCNAVSEQAPPLNPITQQAKYRYAGCFLENDPGRQLQTQISGGNSNTNEACIAQCAAAGYIFAGTQYNSQCWCGYNRPKHLYSEVNCNFPCTGNVNEICGGNGVDGEEAYISTFGDITRWDGNSTNAPGPYVNPGAYGFHSIGCFTEGSQTRALSVGVNANNTVSSCLAACQGYAYSGVEYGGQCYCGNLLGVGSFSAQSTDCSMTCNNNQTEYCGGPSRLNMYVYGNGTVPSTSSIPTSTPVSSGADTAPTSTGPIIPPSIGTFSYVSCYTEGTNTRALGSFSLVDDSITLYTCASNCTSYQYFGVEYGRECYCGKSLGTGSIRATDGRCTMTCSGNSSLACGGPNGLQLYQKKGNVTALSSLSSIVTTSSIGVTTTVATFTSSSSATPTGPTIVPSIGRFVYVDCHTEATGSRALVGNTIASSDMTIQSCAGNCSSFAYFGVEYSQECYCGNALQLGSVAATDGRCSMTCGGNPSTICGGPNGLTLYRFSNTTANATTSSSLSTSPTPSLRSSTTSLTEMSTSADTGTLASSMSSSSFGSSTTSVGFNATSTMRSSSVISTPLPTTVSATNFISNSTKSAPTSALSSMTVFSSLSTTQPGSSSMTLTGSTVLASSVSMSTSNSRNLTTTSSLSTGLSSVNASSTTSITLLSSSRNQISSTASISSTTPSSSSSGATARSSSTATNTNLSSTSSLPTTTSLSSPLLSFITSFTSRSASTTSSLTSGAQTSSFSTTSSKTTSSFPSVTSSTSLASTVQTSTAATIGSTTSTSPKSLSRTTISASANPTSTSKATSSTPSTSTSTTTSTTSPFSPYTALGCYVETNPRLLSTTSLTTANLTISTCLSFCTSHNLPLAGLEYSSQCFCGSTLLAPASSGNGNASGCNMACSGDKMQICGGSSRVNVYNNTQFVYPSHKTVVDGYVFQGCFVDVGSRTLGAYSVSSGEMSQELCVGACKGKGFRYAGVEYGSECWCDSEVRVDGQGGGNATAVGQCGMLCAGDETEFCGSGNRLSVWMGA